MCFWKPLLEQRTEESEVSPAAGLCPEVTVGGSPAAAVACEKQEGTTLGWDPEEWGAPCYVCGSGFEDSSLGSCDPTQSWAGCRHGGRAVSLSR